MPQPKNKAIWAIQREEVENGVKTGKYTIVSKGHKNTADASGWLNARVKDGTLEEGTYFITRVSLCARFHVEVRRDDLDPTSYLTTGQSEIVDVSDLDDALEEKEETIASEPTSEDIRKVAESFESIPVGAVVVNTPPDVESPKVW